MEKIKEKFSNLKKSKSYKTIYTTSIVIIGMFIIFGIYVYQKDKQYKQVLHNQYNMAFYELVECVQNVETLLAKSLISTSPEHGAETLTEVWKDANLAQVYLSQIPIDNDELSQTAKFLNQVSDYSYSVSRENIKNKSLTEEQLNNLEQLHDYSTDLLQTLVQLSSDIDNNNVSWDDLTKKGMFKFAQQVSNISKESFDNIDQNLEDYEGLIYDGAFSEHITTQEKKGLTGDDIDENGARQKVEDFIGKEKIKGIKYVAFSDGDIPSYNFEVELNNKGTMYIDITRKGGHVIFMNLNREISEEKINENTAVEIASEFLRQRGYPSMKYTYYLKESGEVTINFAYVQDNVVVYSDLIKVKIALDNGEVIGIEERGYLNSHYERQFVTPKITIEEAKEKINKNLEILGQGLALIPTEWKSEVLCYEFKGKVKDREFLVYINVETGEEQDIKMIINTPNGTLAM